MTIRNITSKSNPWVKQIRELAHDNTAYKEHRQVWIEGDHLCRSALTRGWDFEEIVLTEDKSQEVNFWRLHSKQITIIPRQLMENLSTLASPSWIGGLVCLPEPSFLNPTIPTVVLDRLQDPGNMGSILRSAAAFGFLQVITTPQTGALWSSKVIRSAMGAHFGLNLFESLSIEFILTLNMPVMVTSSHHGQALQELVTAQQIPTPCMWVMGHEGQGASPIWFEQAHTKVRIEQPGGEESLNVAAAAAICLYASSSRMN